MLERGAQRASPTVSNLRPSNDPRQVALPSPEAIGFYLCVARDWARLNRRNKATLLLTIPLACYVCRLQRISLAQLVKLLS